VQKGRAVPAPIDPNARAEEVKKAGRSMLV
jgi:hypothetical protein